MESTENGYFDEVGGYHESAIGYAPTGEWCGECCRASCKECPTFDKLREKGLKQIEAEATRKAIADSYAERGY